MTDRHRVRQGLVVALLVAVGAVGVVALTGKDAQETRAEAATAKLRTVGAQWAGTAVCVSQDPVDKARFGEFCDTVRELASAESPETVDVDALAASVTSMVLESTGDRVDEAVRDYLEAHPPAAGQSVTVEQIAAAVAGYLSEHPPAGPTEESIAAAVSEYFDRNPPPQGVDGAPGPAPTAEQISTAVGQWLAAHPPNSCPGVWEPYLPTDLPGRTGFRCLAPN